jgi:hypothetical protein
VELEIFTSRPTPAGTERTHLERGLRAGVLMRLRPGACVLRHAWLEASPADRHRAAMDALVLTARRPPVFAHESAALLHGIPVLSPWPEVPHLLDSELESPSRRSPRAAIVHRPRHRPDVTEVDGILTTDVVATAVALAARHDLVAGVAAFDHVLAAGHDRTEIEHVLEAWAPFHGHGRAWRALALATGLAETPLESLSLVGIHLGGLLAPRQQVEFVARGRRYRTDFYWDEFRVIGEADGRVKYGSRADLIVEKEREDALRSLGLGFARWGWDDAWARQPMLERLAEAGVVGAPRIRPCSAQNRRSRSGSAE